MAEDEGEVKEFVCPYHGLPPLCSVAELTAVLCVVIVGWTYALNGRLLKAKRLKGIQEFRSVGLCVVVVSICICPHSQQHTTPACSGAKVGLPPITVEAMGPFVFLHFGTRTVYAYVAVCLCFCICICIVLFICLCVCLYTNSDHTTE